MENIKIFFSMLVTCIALDIVWLGFIAKKLYADSLGSMLRRSGDSLTPNWSAAIIVYLALTLGILLFALPRANGSYTMALVWGGLFGVIVYGVYDFTNLATLANWPVYISVIDAIWGAVICAAVTLVGVFVQSKL